MIHQDTAAAEHSAYAEALGKRPALYSQAEILARASFSRSHLYNLINKGRFPRPAVVIGPRFTRWAAADVDAWLNDPAAWIAANNAESA